MIILVNTTQENRESVLFQPVIKAYLTHHSWMITANVSLGNMEKQWKLFTRQMIRICQLLTSLLWKPSAPTQLLSVLEAELNNLNGIHTSYQPFIQAAAQFLKKGPSLDRIPVSNKCMRRSLLPFLGDTLSRLTGTATTKDVNAINTILNVTRYAIQVNRQHINILMEAMEKCIRISQPCTISCTLYTAA